MSKVFLVRSNIEGSTQLEGFYSRSAMIQYLEGFDSLDCCEIAEISTAMSTSGNRKETLEWKRPTRGGTTW